MLLRKYLSSLLAPVTGMCLLLQSMFLWYCAKFEFLVYNRDYEYPSWAQALGLLLAFSSMSCLPVYFIYKMAISPGNSFLQVDATSLLRTTSLIHTTSLLRTLSPIYTSSLPLVHAMSLFYASATLVLKCLRH